MDVEENDGPGSLIEKWVAPNIPQSPIKYVQARIINHVVVGVLIHTLNEPDH